MIDAKEFIERYCADKPDWYLYTVSLVFDRFQKYGYDDPAAFTKSECVYKLFLTKFGVASDSHYLRVCHVLEDVYRHLAVQDGIIPTYEDIKTYWVQVNMFRSIDDVFAFIDSVGSYWLGYEYNGRRDLVHIKVIAALAWYGLAIPDMICLQSRCTAIDDGQGYLVLGGDQQGQRIPIDLQSIDFLRLLPMIQRCRSLPDGRWSRTKSDEEWLFSRSESNAPDACEKRIHLRWRRFVQNIPEEFSQNISYNVVHDSGICYRIYTDDEDIPLIEKVRKWSGMRDSHSYAFQIMYKKWLDSFYG